MIPTAVPRRKGYNPAQDALYAVTAVSIDAADADTTRVWHWQQDVMPWQRQLRQLLDTVPLSDLISSKSAKKHQKLLDGLLCCAAAAGRLDAIQLLLQAGAHPLCTASHGLGASKPTALHWAAACRQVAAFTLLQQALVLRLGRDTIPTILGLMPVSPLDLLAADMSVARLLDVRSYSTSSNPQAADSDTDDEAMESDAAQNIAPDSHVGEVFGWKHTSLLFSSGHSSNGTLGRGNSGSSSWPKRVLHGIGASGILDIACSQYVSACVTTDGRLFTWGLGTMDRLGHLDRPKSLNLPHRLLDPSSPTIRFVQVAVSSNHGAAVTAEGSLYTWGSGAFGQLGIAASESPAAPESVTEFSSPLTRVKILRSESIRFVACGDRHTVAVTTTGRLYTFGAGCDGQLGHSPPAKDEPYPRLLTSLLNTAVQGSLVAVGPRHTCVVTTSRDIYLFGFGNPTPRRIQFSFGYPSLKAGFCVTSISSCSSSLTRFSSTSVDEVLILTGKGEIYSYLESVDTYPVLVQEPSQQLRVVQVYCSDDANYAVSEMGVLFKFSPRTAKDCGVPKLERIPLIQRVEQVCASRSHILYRVSGPLSPQRAATLADPSPSPFVSDMVSLLVSSRGCDTIIEACEPDEQASVSIVSSASPAGLLCHSWVLARIPALATLLRSAVKSIKSADSLLCISIPVASSAALRIMIQWVYTDQIWTTRSAPPPNADLVLFRHEQHLKSVQSLSRLLGIPSFASACVNGRSSSGECFDLAIHCRTQFISPLLPQNHGLICHDMVKIKLTAEGANETVGVAYAHKCILTLHSEYFSTMLDGSWSESDTSEIRLDSISPVSLHLLLSFMYSRQLVLTEDEREKYWSPQVAFELLALSDELLLPDLARAVELELGSLLKPDSAARLLLAASTYRAEDLLRTTSNYISVNCALLLRLDALAEVADSVDALSQLQDRISAMWSPLPMKDLMGTDANVVLRFVSDAVKRYHQDLSRLSKGSPSSLEKASPKLEPPATIHASVSSIVAPAVAQAHISPLTSPVETSLDSAADAQKQPTAWSKVETMSPTKPLSEILKEEADQRQSAASRSRSYNPWATSAPSSSPKPQMHWAEADKKNIAGHSVSKSSPSAPKEQVRVSTSPKSESTFSLSQLLPKTSPKSPAAAWSAKPVVKPSRQPETAAASPVDFPSLSTSPSTAKASLKDIIQEQKRQIELTQQKARPLKEILEEEALLAEHIRVEEYYAKLKQQETENVSNSAVKQAPVLRGRPDRRKNRSKAFQPPS